MSETWLSVIIPVHDGARFLPATLRSVSHEDTQGVEFLVYDSSNDDGTCRSIVATYSDCLPISYKATPELKPWQAKINRGAAEAIGGHLAILHQDDLWLEGHLESARQAITACPEAAFSVGPSRFIDAEGRDIGPWNLPLKPGLNSQSEFVAKLLVQNTIAIPSPVIRRSAWLESGGMDEELWYTPDWDIYLKLAKHGPVLVRDTATTAFRLHTASLTITGSADLADFRKQHERVLQSHSPSPNGRQARRLIRLAQASIEVNCALAAASQGRLLALCSAIAAIVRLGPVDACRLIRDTRLVDRIRSRLHLLTQKARTP